MVPDVQLEIAVHVDGVRLTRASWAAEVVNHHDLRPLLVHHEQVLMVGISEGGLANCSALCCDSTTEMTPVQGRHGAGMRSRRMQGSVTYM